MVRIVLMCSQGASTSILVQAMKKAAVSQGIECSIEAFSVNELAKVKDHADVILLGPQVKYMVAQVAEKVSCTVDSIEMMKYGMMDGAGVLADAIAAIEERG